MWNKILPIIAFQLFIILLISGCNAFIGSHIYIQHICSPRGSNYYKLHISKMTRELFLGHSGPSFAVKDYSFTLATKPQGRTIYPITKIKRISVSSLQTELFDDFTSGQILVDMDSRMVLVSLKTKNGDFEGNGEYEFQYLPGFIHTESGWVGCPEKN
jgi:hypothetical protein